MNELNNIDEQTLRDIFNANGLNYSQIVGDEHTTVYMELQDFNWSLTQIIKALAEQVRLGRIDENELKELIQVFESHLDSVEPLYSKYGRLRWIAMQSRDLNNYDVEDEELPKLLENAKGILRGDLDIVVAWEAENEKPRQRVFTIKGRGDITRLEYLESAHTELPQSGSKGDSNE